MGLCGRLLDDIMIHSKVLEDHLVHIPELFGRLREANLKITPQKCDVAKKELRYLGYIVSVDGVLPTNKKMRAVESSPRPKPQTEVRSFLGLAGYYRKFISLPLTSLKKDTISFVWTAACKDAIKTLQQALISHPILTNSDFNLPLLLQTDWCTTDIVVVLAQRKYGGEKAIAYASHQLQGAELNCSAIDGECLAVIWAVIYFLSGFYGHRITLQLIIRQLSWIMFMEALQGRLDRWALALQEYMITIE